MMKEEKYSGRVSGFTLLEMAIVLAIVAILSGVMVPAMLGYSARSKLNAQNSNAKVLFNSIQTIVQEYEFLDRSEHTVSRLYGDGDQKQGTLFIKVYNTTGRDAVVDTFDNKRKSGTVASLQGTGGADFHGGSLNAGSSTSFIVRLGRMFPDLSDVSFCALVRDYSVLGVLSAENNTATYIGGYPLRIGERANSAPISSRWDGDVQTISAISRANMVTYCEDAWNDTTLLNDYAS